MSRSRCLAGICGDWASVLLYLVVRIGKAHLGDAANIGFRKERISRYVLIENESSERDAMPDSWGIGKCNILFLEKNENCFLGGFY